MMCIDSAVRTSTIGLVGLALPFTHKIVLDF